MNFIWSKSDDPLLGDILKSMSNDADAKRIFVLNKFFTKVQNAVVSLLKDKAKTSQKRTATISLERLFIKKYDVNGNPLYTPLGIELKNELQQDINFKATELATYGNQLIAYLSTQNLEVKLLGVDNVHVIKIIISWENSGKETEKVEIREEEESNVKEIVL